MHLENTTLPATRDAIARAHAARGAVVAGAWAWLTRRAAEPCSRRKAGPPPAAVVRRNRVVILALTGGSQREDAVDV